jgi:membrane protein implicated in regulation of membrane protease activity
MQILQMWWDSLNFELQCFYGIAIVSLFSLFIQMILSLFMGLGDEAGALGAGDHASGLSIFSVRSVTAFFVGFGWTGVICTKAGYGLPLTLVLSVFAGALLMAAIIFMMLSFIRLQSSGTLDYANAVGQIGTVYVTVPPGQRSGGQVEALIQGRFVIAEALHRGAEPISPGTKVRVVEKIGASTLVIEPLA